MSDVKMPYIKRLEFQVEKLTTALKLVMEHRQAVEFVNITGYKADAQKKADALQVKMNAAVKEALQITGGE